MASKESNKKRDISIAERRKQVERDNKIRRWALGFLAVTLVLFAGVCALLQFDNTCDDGCFGEGTQIVGTDIPPGTYRADCYVGDNCSWTRYANEYDRDGVGSSIFNNRDVGNLLIYDEDPSGTIDPGQSAVQATVEIPPTDHRFHSFGFGIWERVVE